MAAISAMRRNSWKIATWATSPLSAGGVSRTSSAIWSYCLLNQPEKTLAPWDDSPFLSSTSLPFCQRIFCVLTLSGSSNRDRLVVSASKRRTVAGHDPEPLPIRSRRPPLPLLGKEDGF